MENPGRYLLNNSLLPIKYVFEFVMKLLSLCLELPLVLLLSIILLIILLLIMLVMILLVESVVVLLPIITCVVHYHLIIIINIHNNAMVPGYPGSEILC